MSRLEQVEAIEKHPLYQGVTLHVNQCYAGNEIFPYIACVVAPKWTVPGNCIKRESTK